MSWIACINGPDRGLQLELGHQPITIGRAPDNPLRLSEEKASRHHCQLLVIDKQKLALEDLNSTNGTCCGQQVLRGQKTVITVGQQFSVGKDIFEFRRQPDRSLISDLKTDQTIPDFEPDTGSEQTTFDPSCEDVLKDKPGWISRLLGR